MSTPAFDHILRSAIAAVNSGKLDEGRRLLEQCLTFEPNSPGVHDVLARVALEQKRVDDAVRSAQKAVALSPTAAHSTTLGEALSAAGKSQPALDLLLQVLRKSPNDFRCLLACGDIFERHGYRELAAKHFDRALALQPANAALAIQYSNLLIGSDLPRGLAALERAAVGPHEKLDAQLAYLMQLIPYMEWLERARRGEMPFHSTGLRDLFFTHAAAKRNEFESLADQALRERPTDWYANVAKAGCLLSRDRRIEANQHYETIARHYPGSAHDAVTFAPQFFSRIETVDDASIEQGLPLLIDVASIEFNGDHVVYISCSYDYFGSFGRTMLLSLAKAMPGAQVHLHVMDGTDAELVRVRDFCAALDNLKCAISAERPGLVAGTAAARCYYHAIRFIRLLHHLKAYQRTLWMMDIDALINRNLQPMFDAIGDADVAFRARPGRWEPWNQFNASVAAFRPTAQALTYLKLIAAYIVEFHWQGKLRWGIDQLAIYSVHEFLKDNSRAPKVHLLDDRAVDYSYLDDGFVWCNSGASKHAEIELTISGVPVPADPERAKYVNALKTYTGMLT